MNCRPLAGILSLGLLLTGCATNDFKVVDALHAGMTQPEAQATIASYGFVRKEYLTRPEAGWPADVRGRGPTILGVRARYQENELKERIAFAEFYPVYHGMLGYGELFLFYGDEGKLKSFYRHQIN